MINGFFFVHKFALTLLSRNERFLRNNIKNETKNLKIGATVDALVVSGNAARTKLLRRNEKLPIDNLIKKALNKPKYVALIPSNFF